MPSPPRNVPATIDEAVIFIVKSLLAMAVLVLFVASMRIWWAGQSQFSQASSQQN
jgi:hypothetical protein